MAIVRLLACFLLYTSLGKGIRPFLYKPLTENDSCYGAAVLTSRQTNAILTC